MQPVSSLLWTDSNIGTAAIALVVVATECYSVESSNRSSSDRHLCTLGPSCHIHSQTRSTNWLLLLLHLGRVGPPWCSHRRSVPCSLSYGCIHSRVDSCSLPAALLTGDGSDTSGLLVLLDLSAMWHRRWSPWRWHRNKQHSRGLGQWCLFGAWRRSLLLANLGGSRFQSRRLIGQGCCKDYKG